MSKIQIMNELLNELRKGGPGSGNHGHAGRPGKQGGSTTGNIKGMKPGTRFRPNEWGGEVEVIQRKNLYGVPGYMVKSPSALPGQMGSYPMFMPDKHITRLKITEPKE